MTNNTQIVKNLLFNTISFAVNFVISFFFTPYLIRTIGKEAYSFIPLINSIIGYSSIITSAVGSMAGRFITMRIYQNDIEGANKYFNSVWLVNILLSVFFTIVSIFAIVFIDNILSIPTHLISDVRCLFGLGSLSLVLGLLTGILGIGVFVKNRVDLSASRAAIAECFRITSILALFFFFKPSIIYMSLGGLFSAILFIFFNIKFKGKLLPELSLNPIKHFSLSHFKDVFFSGIWNSVNQLSSILLQQFDLLITNLFLGVSVTGDYSIAKTAPIFIYSILAMLSGTFVPHFNILFAKNEIKELVHEIKKSMTIVGMLIGIPIGFLLIYSRDFYKLWVPGEDANALYWLTFITILPMIFGGSINPIFGVFSTTNKLKVPSLVLLGAGILNTVTIFILLATTELGIWAIAITGAVQGGLRNLFFSTIYGAKCLNQKWYTFFPTVAKGVCGMGTVAIISYIIKKFIPCNSWIVLVLSLCLISSISLAMNSLIMFTTKDRQAIFNMIKKKFS